MYWNIALISNPLINDGLIETWDVLKSAAVASTDAFLARLIETWDVLKSVMRNPKRIFFQWLIETWDVLKCI